VNVNIISGKPVLESATIVTALKEEAVQEILYLMQVILFHISPYYLKTY
jgi:hypothetical protein